MTFQEQLLRKVSEFVELHAIDKEGEKFILQLVLDVYERGVEDGHEEALNDMLKSLK